MALDFKRFVKDILAQIDYFLYRSGFKKCSIRVHTIEETIEELTRGNKSMIRFGDGEITMIRGRSLKLQQVEPEIIDGLKRLLQYEYEDMIVTIPDIFDDLSIYRRASRQFWKDHLLFSRKIYEKYCNPGREYYNTSISRFYITLDDHGRCREWMEGIRQIWKDKDIVVVEGERTHNGVGNDLFDLAGSVERIIGPSSDAYGRLDEIMQCCREYPRDRLFLISLGVAAKFLAERLFLEGYRALDIGNLDMEYEWYLSGAKQKEEIAKHSIIGETANRAAGYDEYLDQIKYRVTGIGNMRPKDRSGNFT
ncbi:MAG: GT-D fold domain-containing glycosyltransferase [Ruminococcus flavefaciens]|nr:GT-D fold domain-containing glycosyltransferase [Eubacterium sp.]MCM1236785.1 GT-D fold domain-containing glycosyltransferase [Ruminococcus flavefaciens]